MPITADELRLAGHHLEAAEASLRLAAHFAYANTNMYVANRIEMLRQQVREVRYAVAERRKTSP